MNTVTSIVSEDRQIKIPFQTFCYQGSDFWKVHYLFYGENYFFLAYIV